MKDKVLIERTTESGYSEQEYSVIDAVVLLNSEIENKRTIWIDSKPFFGDTISASDIQTCKKEISVTNRLIGG